jgi:ankyrin repeat protein
MVAIRLLAVGILAVFATPAQQNRIDSDQLQSAVSKGHRLGSEQYGVAAVEELLDRGLNVNAKDGAGWTALMMASLEGLPRVVEVLLNRGANPNARSNKGETALIIGAGCFIVRTRADLVFERGFGPDMRVQQLNAPRMMVEALVQHGADVNAATQDGRTPLMNAVMHAWVDVADALIGAGAHVNAKDNKGRIAMDYAQPTDVLLISLLRAAGSLRGSGHSGRTVCDAQAALNQLGFRSGHPDCWGGTSTADALREFLKKKGLRVSG